MPLGKFLPVEEEDYPEVAADPIAAKYLQPFHMGKELVRGLNRWFLWMVDEDFDPVDVNPSPALKSRVSACKEWRSAQTPTGEAYKFKDTPHLFRPNKS